MQTEADCFSPEAQKLAEARLAAKRAARAEAREIRMKELERQQKEIYQVQKKYYGLDTKWGDIEQWMEDSERYSRRSRRNASASDEDERMSVGSRGSLRSDLEYASAYPVAGLENERTKKKNSKATNGYDEDMYGSSQSRKSSRSSNYSGESRKSTKKSSREEKSPSLLYSDVLPARSYRASLYDESIYSGNRRYSASSSRAPSEYSCYLGSGSRASSRASSARASPVVEERPEKDFEKGARTVSSLSAATLASLGGTSSRRGSGDTSISVDTEASIREIKDINELKNQIQDVEGKYMQGLKEMKDSLAEVEEKYKKAMVSNAQLDNEKTNFMYQVDTLKDALLELEEQLAESRRQYEEKSKEFEREKHAHSILQFQFTEIKETLKQREEMLEKHGIIPNLEVATNGEALDGLDNEAHSDSTKITPGATQTLQTAGDGTLGRANEVEMKDEILEDVGKREILQNTEHEEHKEESEEREIVKECTERKTLHADENTEAEKTMEDNDVTSTVMLSSGCEEQIQSHTEHVSGNVSSTENSDVIELRKETESGDDSIEAQQLGSKESEHSDLNHLTNENWETGTLQSQGIETPLGIPTDIDTEHESERVAQEQKVKQEDFTICQREDSIEIFQEALDFVVSSHASASEQSGSPEGARAGTGNEESHVEAHTESLCQAEESTENEVMSSLEKQLDEDEGCIDRTISKVGSGKNESDTAKEENKTGNTVPSQGRKEVDSVEEEGEATCESEVTPDTIVNEQKPDETHTLSTFSKSDLILAEEEGNMQDEAENEKDIAGKGQTKDIGKMEELTGMLDVQPDSENKRVEEEEPVASLDEFAEIKEGVSHQTGQDQDVMKESQSQETILVPCPSDHEIEESNTEMWDESRKGKESRGELMEDERTQVETQTIKCSEEIKNNPIQEKEKTVENEMQKVVKQEEDESRQELTQDVSVIIEENVDDKEASVESSEKLDLPDQQHDRFVSDDSSLQKITKLSQQLSESLEGNTKEMEVQNAVLDDACQLSRKEGDTKQMGNGNEEDENKGIEEQHELQEVKKQEVVPDIEEDADYLKTQKAELDEKPDEQVEVEGQEEEIVEDDGKKIDFDDELGQILKAPGKHDAEEVTTQTLEEVREKEIVTETAKTEKGEKEETHQSRTQSVENEGMITEGNASIQQEKGKGTEEAGHLQTDASQSAAPEKACDLVEDETGNEKVLDSNDMEKIADGYSSEQELGNVGNTRDESKEDMQASRRGKGRSKEDCMIS
ncbi:leucine-rich repeat flightless-interacting protein 1 isoform X16 [Trachemys scripta elegans]|uniref:leucine-rich repeat flightless-interacting protein 1 isoform X16 n=1 Tax=Trachemys scripta elegans TaxID=31138 RepID=UPI001553E51E|nr:leucine-rich repeat flightless-interacting protein 1 isoform X16 [Trachemys scripta elegans]